ncbi:hypothetical protein B1A99_15880 [Cohnella sp. CIP 111063]|uniref:hypothetical protein n=1 Tax=unclassified Cohnella TaxID=2636738 RepID=UPI000B8BEE1A|nr:MULTISPECIES: hypothetical protein [unclassified Cohnella]OXS58102.1 hypothetical protein B1A99_15880 [Cohnella sp. CIP 111063]PRX71446.1 hypothetical protein B0G52_109246 [Cohnella sp. SGD-V74]
MNQQTISWVFSGVGITVMLSFLKLIFVPYPIINITLEEKAFLPGVHRFIRRLFIEFSTMLSLIYLALLSTAFNYEKHHLIRIFPYTANQVLPSWLIIFSEIMAVVLFLFLLIMYFSERVLTFCHEKMKQRQSLFWLFLILLAFYFITLNCTIGYTMNWILGYLNLSLDLNQKSTIDTLLALPNNNSYIGFSIIVLLSYGIYRLLLQPVVMVFNKISTTVILATITLTDGTKLYNKYILRPSVDGNILIGDQPQIKGNYNKIMLPKSSIFLIEFKRINKSIGNKDITTKRILLPPDFK